MQFKLAFLYIKHFAQHYHPSCLCVIFPTDLMTYLKKYREYKIKHILVQTNEKHIDSYIPRAAFESTVYSNLHFSTLCFQ